MNLNPVMTQRDEQRFKSYTPSAARGILIIESMTNSELRATIRDPDMHAAICYLIGAQTNPMWVTGQALGELYERSLISEVEFNFYDTKGYLPLEHEDD